MNYRDYIKDKDVVFIGACPNISCHGMGPVFDAYDVVVKTNGSVFLEGGDYYKNYGSRIDVLYTNNQFYRELSPFPLEDWKCKGIKHLRMKTCNNLDEINKHIQAEKITESIAEVNKDLHGATMGAYIFNDILRCNPKRFMVTGIDFFASKKAAFEHDNYQEYIKGYLPDKIRKQGNEINKGKTKDGHDFYKNAEYIYNLYMKYDNFLMPKFIEDILFGIIAGEIDQK